MFQFRSLSLSLSLQYCSHLQIIATIPLWKPNLCIWCGFPQCDVVFSSMWGGFEDVIWYMRSVCYLVVLPNMLQFWSAFYYAGFSYEIGYDANLWITTIMQSRPKKESPCLGVSMFCLFHTNGKVPSTWQALIENVIEQCVLRIRAHSVILSSIGSAI